MPPLVAGAAIAAGGLIVAGLENESAVNTASTAQSTAAADTLDFQKQQAQLLAQQQNTTAQANYDQWAAGVQQMNGVRSALGLPTETVPAFVPQPQPNFTGAPSSATPSPTPSPSPTPGATPAPTPGSTGAPPAPSSTVGAGATPTDAQALSYAQTLLNQGMSPQQVATTVAQLYPTAGAVFYANPSAPGGGTVNMAGGYLTQNPQTQQWGPVAKAVTSGTGTTPQSVSSYLQAPMPMTTPQQVAPTTPYTPQPYYSPQSVDQYLQNPFGGAA